MLSAMRKSAGSWMIKILLGLIVLAFVFMGAGSFYSQRDNEVATVNGTPITKEEYQRTYDRIVQNLEQRFGDRLDEELLDSLNIEQQVLDRLIEKHLIMQAAEKNHISMPDEVLANWLTRIPAFQNNGSFDPELYRRVLSQNRLSPEAFEAMQKEEMLTETIRDMVGKAVPVSQAEARAWYDWENTEVNVEYAVFSPGEFSDVDISDKEAENYFEQNKEDYKTPPKIKARYIRFTPGDYRDKVEVSEAEIKDYYDSHRSEFKEPETVEARHILLKVPQDADAETETEIREKAAAIRKRADGEDFAELARRFSEDPSAEEGGYLGELEEDDTVEEFSEKAFSLDTGEISEPVRTRFGWHIIKIDDRTDESVKPLEKVEGKIKEELALQKARDLAYEEAFSIYDISFEGDDLVKNARDKDLELGKTDFFTRNSGPEDMEGADDFAEAAFSLPMGEISEVREIADAYYLIQPLEKQEAGIPELDSVIEEVREDALRQKQQKTARLAAENFLETADSSESFSKAGETTGNEIKNTGFFKRNQPVPEIGQNQPFSSAAFSLRDDDPVADSVVAGENERFYVLRLKERKTPQDSDFQDQKQEIESRLAERKRTQAVNRWVESMRQAGEIEISDKFSDLSG
ncbi:MAG: SurA N-terminal domain-containing protein [Desulfosalsimonas sp.]